MQIICWFDGASQNNGTLCGAGGIIRTGGNTYYRWTLNCGMGTNTRAELLGVWASLSLAHRLGIDQLQVLGDSKIVVDWLNHKCNLFVSSLLGWMEKIRILVTLFNDIKFDHIYREENVEADTLSKNPSRFWKGGSTSTNGRTARRAPHLHCGFIYDIASTWGHLWFSWLFFYYQ
jgi:ribonuclease HI